MIEEYINNFEFPVYEAIQKSDFVYYRRASILKQMVKAANSYKNTPPCPMPKGDKIIPCATLCLKLGLKNIKRYTCTLGHFEDILDAIHR